MRQRFCRSCRGWHDVDQPWPMQCADHWGGPKARSDAFPVPYFICDTMDELQSMADGKHYSSKSAMRASYKAENNPHGVDFIEVGNQNTATFTPPKRDRKGEREAIERAINDVEYGNAPPILTTDQFPI